MLVTGHILHHTEVIHFWWTICLVYRMGWAVVVLWNIVVSHPCTKVGSGAFEKRLLAAELRQSFVPRFPLLELRPQHCWGLARNLRSARLPYVSLGYPQRRCSRGSWVARPVVNVRNVAFADMAACGAGGLYILPGTLLIQVGFGNPPLIFFIGKADTSLFDTLPVIWNLLLPIFYRSMDRR